MRIIYYRIFHVNNHFHVNFNEVFVSFLCKLYILCNLVSLRHFSILSTSSPKRSRERQNEKRGI